MGSQEAVDLVFQSVHIAFCLPATAFLLACAAFLATIGLFSKRDGGRIPRFLASAGLLVVAMVHGWLILVGVWLGVFINPPDYWRMPLLGLTVYVLFASTCVLFPRGRMARPVNLSPEIV
jgi:hypothetical protein